MWSVLLGGNFSDYDAATNRLLEEAWQKDPSKQGRTSINLRGDRYEICFRRMQQQRADDPKKHRAVQRLSLPAQLAPAGPSPSVPSPAVSPMPAPAQASQPPADAIRSVVDEIESMGTFGLGLICGPTASGKSQLLDKLVQRGVVGAAERKEQWPKYTPVVSHLATRRGGVQAAMDRLNTIGLNTVPTWMLNFGALSNGQQERCSLALALDHRKQFDNFGGFVEPHTRRLLAAGMARIVSKAQLSNLVVASVDVELAAWMQPDWLVVLDARGVPTLTRRPPLVTGRRLAAEVSIQYLDDAFDTAGAQPAVDPVLSLARRHGANATTSSALAVDSKSPGSMEVQTSVTIDEATFTACKVTGMEMADVNSRRFFKHQFVVPTQLTNDSGRIWNVAVVLGASGSGKSLALKAVKGTFRRPGQTSWPAHEGVAAVLSGVTAGTLDERLITQAIHRHLGLLPSASCRPHAQLSSGERCLADIAHAVASARCDATRSPIIIDEFTSVLDRTMASHACAGLRQLMQAFGVDGRKLVVATVHADVVPFLRPQLLVLTSHKLLHQLHWPDALPSPPPDWGIGDADPFARPRLRFELRTAPDHPKEVSGSYTSSLWDSVFKEHHYKDNELMTAATVDVLRLAETDQLVGMVATITHFGSLDKRNLQEHQKSKTRREHRVVVLPSWQGLGIGPALSDLSASLWTATRHGDDAKTDHPTWRYMSTTAHPRFGAYRNNDNPVWKPTSTNGKDGKYSHEYVGAAHAFAAGSKRRLPMSGSESKRARLAVDPLQPPVFGAASGTASGHASGSATRVASPRTPVGAAGAAGAAAAARADASASASPASTQVGSSPELAIALDD